ncbi:MAG: VOC family protein [Clostridia bacterium]|nr:VOC family protein [Clostridia bacterium]
MTRGVHHIAILCSDKARALRFYADALGFTLIRTVERPERGDEILLLQAHGTMLEIFIASDRPPRVSDPEAYGLRHLAFCVEHIEQLVEHVKACGFEPEPIRRDSMNGNKMTFVKDPDGLPIELHE